MWWCTRPTCSDASTALIASYAARWARSVFLKTRPASPQWTIFPGVCMPVIHPKNIEHVGSLNVAQYRTRVPNRRAQSAAHRENSSTEASPSKPWHQSSSQMGWVKWWSVADGSMPLASSSSKISL